MIEKDDNLPTIKLGCLGDSTVGKTFLTKKFVDDITNTESTLSTIGNEYYITKRNLSDGNQYKIIIYDTAGQEKFRSLSLNSIRHCDGVILMYDITNRNSFDSISKWVKDIYDVKEENFPLILIGNKYDLKDHRQVSEKEGLETAEKYKTLYFETSALEGINVEKSIDELLNKIISKKIIKNKTLKLDARKSKVKTKHKCCG